MNERVLSKVLVVPTALVVLILAVLLYRWSNEISQATSVRLADSLQMSMINWHLNLYRDLSDVAGALRVDSENSGNLDLYARRFKEWRASTQYRELVSGVFVFKDVGSERPIPLHLNPDTVAFEPVQWSADLASLWQDLRKVPLEKAPAAYFPRGLAGWKFEPAALALVRQIDGLAGSWLVVALDKQTIQSRILPDLSKRYFMGVDGLDYLVAVVSGPERREVIYSSDVGFGDEEVPDADGRMDVFGRVTSRSLGSPLQVFHKLSNANLSGLAASMGRSWFPLLDEGKDENGWQLIVRHRRGGALGAFVAELHRRDLAISFGVLFLLVISIAMLIVTSLRANRLAKLQMDFVTAVSHELRSPLTIIGSAADNITHGVVGGREQLEQYGKVIQSQTHQLSRLVEEVLLFAATRENRHRYDPRLLEVNDIAESALSSTSDLIEAAHFRVERDIPATLPPVRGDLAALSQCLQNLITNALKYGGAQRWIGIRGSVHDEGLTGGKEVQICVSDRGMGIEPRDLPYIFEPFYRSSSATSAQIHGTGLGLSLAKNIAEAMQGRLTVVSEAGRGTTFTLHLPVIVPGAS